MPTPIDETTGTTTNDAVGNNGATLTGGAIFVPGKNGNGVALNGSGPFVDTGAGLLDTSDYTAMAWVKLVKPNVGQWYHLTGVRDAAKGELKLYLDGELVATRSACSLDATSATR